MNKIKESFKSISSRQGGYSVILTAAAIAIVIVINLIAGQLPESVRQVDISTNKIYEITDTSRNLLKKLDKDITFTVLADKGTTDKRIKKFLSKYASLSNHINVKWIDPVLHPSALTKYDTDSNTIVVSCDDTDKTTTVAFSSIIVYDQMSYYTSGTSAESEFDGEGQLTGAVNYVTSNAAKTIYTVTGHGESSLPTSVADLMEKSNLKTDELNLLMADSIPEDCDLLMFNSPANDLSEEELSLVKSYLEKDGKVFFILGEAGNSTPNLTALFKTYGLIPQDGYIADTQRCYQGNYYYIFPVIQASGDMAKGLASEMVLLVNSHGFTKTEPERDTITLTPFMTTSSDGYAVTEDNNSAQGTYVLGAVATENNSRLTVISTDTMIDENITAQFTNIENLTLFMNAVTSNFDDVDNLSIESKSLQIENNTMKYTGIIGLSAIIGLPVLFLLYGLRQWMKRRKA